MWPEHAFKLESWLDNNYISSLPPFSRGPRNCICQDLAIIEGKVLLALVALEFGFEKIGWTGENGETEVSNGFAVTSVPKHDIWMKVGRLRESS